MIDFPTYWGRIVGNNPRLSDETGYIKMSVGEFQRQLELCWREAAQESAPTQPSEFFNLLFGGRTK